LDHINECLDKDHFLSYPHKITYCYNSRGFRDQEWPVSESELKNAIWCVGDSFTVGLGSPLLHTWPSRLAELSNRRTINVSMDGASNEWIARTAQSIVNSICPMHMVIMWSYTHRRELNDVTLNVENRRLFRIQNLLNFLPVEQQDWARDGHHFDLITAEWVATQAMIQLSR
jgi:hypothetical protein